MVYLGIDPGASGAIAALTSAGPIWIKLSETEHDVSEWLANYANRDGSRAIIEQVNAMPKQGLSSTFKFGKSYGFLIGLLTAHRVPYKLATPRTWMRAIGTMSGGDKNLTKAAAQRMWPDLKITHANADALLIAEYCRRTWN